MARRTPIDAFLAPRVTALLTRLPAALAGDPDSVHQARVASRRLREVLPAFAQAGDISKARKAVRRVTHALGPVRELDVALGHFEAAVAAHPVRPTAQMAVRRSLRTARAAALRKSRKRLSPPRRGALETALDAVAAGEVAPGVVAAAATVRLGRAALRLNEALEHLTLVYDPARLHEVRIAVKRLRYALEASTDLRGSRRAPARLRQLRAIQDLLGRAHDLHVLATLLIADQERLVTRSRGAARDLGGLADALDIECRALHAAFVSRHAALAALVRHLTGVAGAEREETAA